MKGPLAVLLLVGIASLKPGTALAEDLGEVAFYRTQSATSSPGRYAEELQHLPRNPAAIVRTVQGLVVHGGWLNGVTPSEEQIAGLKKSRTVEEILGTILALDPRPLNVCRPVENRFIGNCRTFALLTASIFRDQGVPARVRFGYATYTAGDSRLENHVLVEYLDKQRWVLVDPQIDEGQREAHKLDFDTLDMPRNKFVLAGQAWQGLHNGTFRQQQFGLTGPNGWEPKGFQCVQIDLLADCWALDKVELITGESNDFTRIAHDALSAHQIELFNKLAGYSIADARNIAEFRPKIEEEPAFRVDPAVGHHRQ